MNELLGKLKLLSYAFVSDYPKSQATLLFGSSTVPSRQRIIPTKVVSYLHSLMKWWRGSPDPSEYPTAPSHLLYTIPNNCLWLLEGPREYGQGKDTGVGDGGKGFIYVAPGKPSFLPDKGFPAAERHTQTPSELIE